MAITKTAHPPAGATALLAVVSDDSLPLGWLLVPTMLLGAVLMVIVALFVNNMQRKFPHYWWSPENLAKKMPENLSNNSLPGDLEKNAESQHEGSVDQAQIIIRRDTVFVPSHVYLTPEEKTLLEELTDRL